MDAARLLLSFAWEKAMTRFVFLIRSTISPRLFDATDTVWSFHFPATPITKSVVVRQRVRDAWSVSHEGGWVVVASGDWWRGQLDLE